MVYADVLRAFAWIAANAAAYRLDPDRVYVGGGSSGGHLTIATAVLYPLEKSHAVHLRGAIDLYGGYFTEQLTAKATPLLIIQGTADKSCLPEASRYMAGLYRQAGAWCRMFLVQGMVHDWGGARYMDKIIMRMQEFIRWTSQADWPQEAAAAANHREQYLRAETIETAGFAGGSFSMGNDIGELNERPAHLVSLSPFRMGRTEVTVAQFREFVNETGYRTEAEAKAADLSQQRGWVLDLMRKGSAIEYFIPKADASWRNPWYPQDDSFPAALISYRDSLEFCNWLSKRDQLTPCYRIEGATASPVIGANGWRLPSEAEWEFAAKAGWEGIPVRREDLYLGVTAYYPRAFIGPALAGSSDKSGLFWMLGNVTEWCEDAYAPYPAQAAANPRGPADTGSRVVRGGSWYQNWYVIQLEPSKRWWEIPDDKIYSYQGFRVARSGE